MNQTLTKVAIVFALPLLAGCVSLLLGSNSPSQNTLYDREWTVISVDGAMSTTGRDATLRFASDGRVSGRSFCNRFTGSYSVDGRALAMGQLAATRMACIPPVMIEEQQLLDALAVITHWNVSDDTLTLSGGGREIRARYRF